jgi:hypothetical protein
MNGAATLTRRAVNKMAASTNLPSRRRNSPSAPPVIALRTPRPSRQRAVFSSIGAASAAVRRTETCLSPCPCLCPLPSLSIAVAHAWAMFRLSGCFKHRLQRAPSDASHSATDTCCSGTMSSLVMCEERGHRVVGFIRVERVEHVVQGRHPAVQSCCQAGPDSRRREMARWRLSVRYRQFP